MPGAGFSITLDEGAWKDALEALARLEKGLQLDFSRFIGEELFNVAQEAFAKEADPETGVSWAPWSSTYKESNRHGAKLLHKRGDLQRSITYEAMPEMVIVGSTMVYAPTHQFGEEKGATGKTTKYGVPIPFGDIPARPFLGIDPGFEDRVLGDPAILELLGVTA
jgi:phage virion morphogenesis protein